MKNYFRALRHRNYRLYFGGQTLSLFGTWMQQVAQSWFLYRLTASPVALGVLALAQFGPACVGTPIGGAIVDRHDKRSLLIATQVGGALLALGLGLLALAQIAGPGHVLLFAFLLGIVSAVENPARQAIVLDLVGREDLTNAIGLNSAMMNLARLGGPVLAGAAIAVVGEGWCFLANAFSYLAVIVALGAMNLPRAARDEAVSRSLYAELREGASFVWALASGRALLALLLLSSIAGMPYMVLLPAFAVRVLSGGPGTFGFLMAAQGAGALAGAFLFAGRRGTDGLPRMAAAGGLLFGLGLAALGLAHSITAAVLLLFFVGAGFMIQLVALNAFLQAEAPDGLRGRVIALYAALFAGGVPVGGLLAGWLAVRIGEGAVIGAGGLLVAAGAGFLFARQRRG